MNPKSAPCAPPHPNPLPEGEGVFPLNLTLSPRQRESHDLGGCDQSVVNCVRDRVPISRPTTHVIIFIERDSPRGRKAFEIRIRRCDRHDRVVSSLQMHFVPSV